MSVDKFGRHSSGQIYMEPGVSVRYVNYNFVRRDGSNDVGGDISINKHKLVISMNPRKRKMQRQGVISIILLETIS